MKKKLLKEYKRLAKERADIYKGIRKAGRLRKWEDHQ